MLLNVLPRSILDIRTRTGDTMAWINTTLPERLRSGLTDALKCAFGQDRSLYAMDSSNVDPDSYVFQTLHFSWYNRMATTVGSRVLFCSG